MSSISVDSQRRYSLLGVGYHIGCPVQLSANKPLQERWRCGTLLTLRIELSFIYVLVLVEIHPIRHTSGGIIVCAVLRDGGGGDTLGEGIGGDYFILERESGDGDVLQRRFRSDSVEIVIVV